MPESRNRPKHYHHVHPASHSIPAKRKRSAAVVLAIAAAILGLAVAFFLQGEDALPLIIGALTGAVIGYFIGYKMDKAFAKNK